MQVTLKRTILMLILVLALLLSLAGWMVRAVTIPATPNHVGTLSSHSIAWYCPPPPRIC